MDREFDPTTVSADEAEALESLDDTSYRPLPDDSSFWEAQRDARPTHERRSFSPRMKTIALVSAVGVVSFVAGGAWARMSSQVPVLFGQEAATANQTVARYVEPKATQEEPDAVSEEEAQPAPTDERPTETAPLEQEPTDTEEASPVEEEPAQDSHEMSWNFDEQGDRSLSYDTDSDRVTLDYDGYSLTFDLGDLWPEGGTGDSWQDQGDATTQDTVQQDTTTQDTMQQDTTTTDDYGYGGDSDRSDGGWSDGGRTTYDWGANPWYDPRDQDWNTRSTDTTWYDFRT